MGEPMRAALGPGGSSAVASGRLGSGTVGSDDGGPGASGRLGSGAVGSSGVGSGVAGSGRLGSFGGALRAELLKAWTLPAVRWTLVGLPSVGALLTAALASSQAGASEAVGAAPSVAEVTLGAVVYVQAGLVLLGALPVAHEYAGAQRTTSLVAVPARSRLLLAKFVATAVVVGAAAATTVGAGLLTALLMRAADVGDLSRQGVEALLGAVAYLALIGLLSFAVSLVLRHLTPALVTVLSVVFIVSPLGRMFTEHARWLPDAAGRQLYQNDDAILSAGRGALVLLAWIIAIGATGAFRFARSDA